MAGNIELRQFDITQITREFGEFDYIIAHGVYSWIPPNARDHLLRVCKENLSPNGVAYVSYNVYPGWHMRGMIRDMMLYHARQFPDIGTQVQQARALLDFLGETVPTENSPFGMMLKLELQTLRKQDDSYIAHEFLEGDNASGARILGSLVLDLRRRGGGLGCAAICSGGGQGDAVIIEVDGG